jgi:ribosome-binding protein aMBF1 (putative translation factor)
MVSGMQIRCARSALRWSVLELAARSKVSTSTIKRIEAQDGRPSATFANVAALQSAFESAGITFVGTADDGPGIRLQPTR